MLLKEYTYKVIGIVIGMFSLVYSSNAQVITMEAADEKNLELARGYVYVKQIDGVWWFIGPDGQKFWSTGVNHIEPHLYLAPYNKDETMAKYGKDLLDDKGKFNTTSGAAQRLIDGQIKIAKDLHFNTFAKHTHPSIDKSLYREKAYYIASFETAPVADWQILADQGPLPDVFSTDFQNHLEKRVKEVVLKHKNSPNLLGYLYCDVPLWIYPTHVQEMLNEYEMVYPWAEAITKLGVSSPGKRQWLEHLKGRYSNAEEAAKVWGIYYIEMYGLAWDELLKIKNWTTPVDSKRAISDMRSFMGVIAEKWYSLHYKAVKKYDNKHLILGDKSFIDTYEKYMIPVLKKYVDVVAIQSYSQWKDDKEKVAWIYNELGKPIFNGDGSHAYVHPKQKEHKVKGWWSGSKNLEDVIKMYADQMIGMMSTPYVIGMHHCGMLQQWDGSARGDVSSNENGFMDPFENYYLNWTDIIREINSNAVKIHKEAVPIELDPLATPTPTRGIPSNVSIK